MVNGPLYHGPQEDSAVAHCEKFAQQNVDKITQIHSNLDAVVNTGLVDVAIAPGVDG